jgi:hypothetical protein
VSTVKIPPVLVKFDRRASGLAALLAAAAAVFLATTPARSADNVAGNLIQFQSDGNWSWYMDERAIIDPAGNRLLVSSQASSNATGIAGGTVFTTTYDLGSRTPARG